jgi:hypothetical protein
MLNFLLLFFLSCKKLTLVPRRINLHKTLLNQSNRLELPISLYDLDIYSQESKNRAADMDGCNNDLIKGSVQRKLRWVENGVNRSVGASDCGAGHSFVVLFRFRLGFVIFPFPASTARIIGDFLKNR